VSPKAAVVAEASTTALTVAAHGGKNVTNTGAGGAVVYTLPAAADAAGVALRIQVTAAQTVTLEPAGTDKVYLGGSGVAGKYALIAGVIGNFATIWSDGVDWHITAYSGVVTKEA
jgi:hypothetical protein